MFTATCAGSDVAAAAVTSDTGRSTSSKTASKSRRRHSQPDPPQTEPQPAAQQPRSVIVSGAKNPGFFNKLNPVGFIVILVLFGFEFFG